MTVGVALEREKEPGVLMHCTTGCGCCMARRGLTLKDLTHDALPSDEAARLEIVCTYVLFVGLEAGCRKVKVVVVALIVGCGAPGAPAAKSVARCGSDDDQITSKRRA